jgi:hypothetical protein
VNEYGVDEDDEEFVEAAVADHDRVPCNPLVIFKARVEPLSMATRIEDLSDWYYTTLEYVLQLKEIQQ